MDYDGTVKMYMYNSNLEKTTTLRYFTVLFETECSKQSDPQTHWYDGVK